MTAYADALRLEYGTDLHVSTVYPGYVRTPIHDAGREIGLALEGQVRREEVEDIVGTVLRTLTAARPPRDTAGTRAGSLELWAGRHLPGLVGAAVARRIRRQAASGHFDGSPLAAGLVDRLASPTAAGCPPPSRPHRHREERPMNVKSLNDREATAERLLRSSLDHSYEPSIDIDWQAPLAADGWGIPAHRVSLYGTELWEGLTDEQRRTLSVHELCSIARIGLWFEMILMQMLLRYAYDRDPRRRHVQYALTRSPTSAGTRSCSRR